MIRRLRRRLRHIDYYSASRPRSAWVRWRERALALSLGLSVPVAFATESVVRREGTLETLRGAIAGDPGGPWAATLQNDDGTTTYLPITYYGDFTLRIVEEQRGWPFPSVRRRPPARFDLNVFTEETVRRGIVLGPDAPERVAIELAMATRGGLDRFRAAWDVEGPPPPERSWRGFVANAALWWLMLSVSAWAGIALARALWFLVRVRTHVARSERLAMNRCAACGYDMRGLEFHARCPECGALTE